MLKSARPAMQGWNLYSAGGEGRKGTAALTQKKPADGNPSPKGEMSKNAGKKGRTQRALASQGGVEIGESARRGAPRASPGEGGMSSILHSLEEKGEGELSLSGKLYWRKSTILLAERGGENPKEPIEN